MSVLALAEQENRNFYNHPSGFASHGGYEFLCGLPCKASETTKELGGEEAYLKGYDHAAKLWPTPESREWFTP